MPPNPPCDELRRPRRDAPAAFSGSTRCQTFLASPYPGGALRRTSPRLVFTLYDQAGFFRNCFWRICALCRLSGLLCQIPDIFQRRDRVLPFLVGRGGGGKSQKALFCRRIDGIPGNSCDLRVGTLRVEDRACGVKQGSVGRWGDDAGRLCFFERAADVDERLRK